MRNREDDARLFEQLEEVEIVETDENGYITRLRAWIDQKPVELYPATDEKIGVRVTD